eukprot:765790-Hanusia_phi.AAC.3
MSSDASILAAMELSVLAGHFDCNKRVAAECNRLEVDKLEDHVRMARSGLRDDAHTAKEQLLGTQLLMANLTESQLYDAGGLEPTRFRGWSRNDVIHTHVSLSDCDADGDRLDVMGLPPFQ